MSDRMGVSARTLVMMTLLLTVLSACSAGRKAAGTSTGNTKAPVVADYDWVKELSMRKLQPRWFQAKARIQADLPDENYSFTAQIKLELDKVLWMSFRKFGIEVARVYITQDSMIVLNRVERSYTHQSLEAYGRQLGFPVSLRMMQELMLGNPVLQSSIEWCQDEKTKVTTIKGVDAMMRSETVLHPPQWTLDQMMLTELAKNRVLSSKYKQYQPLRDNKFFSYLRTYEIAGDDDDRIFLEIQFTEIQWESPFEVQLEIPGRYQRM